MDYTKLTLEELQNCDFQYLKKHWNAGWNSDSDLSINDIARAKILKFNEKHGKSFLGKYHLPRGSRLENYQLTEYIGQEIQEFQYDFIVPVSDVQLIELIKKNNIPVEPYDRKTVMDKIEAITNRVVELGGIFLSWA